MNFFVSRAFLIGVPVALAIYYLLPTARLQVPLLIGTSLVIFWFAAGNQVLLVCFAALVTAMTSLGAVQAQPARRRLALWIGVGLNLRLLIFFKYKRLLIPETLYRELFGTSPVMSAIYNFALPVGISFYVFHGISLVVDSYRDRAVIDASTEPPNTMTHLVKTYNYITFFPQIVAGPIVKGKAFYGQIRRKRLGDVRWWDAISALSQGYFLKEVNHQFIAAADGVLHLLDGIHFFSCAGIQYFEYLLGEADAELDDGSIVGLVRVKQATFGGNCGGLQGNFTYTARRSCLAHRSCDIEVDRRILEDRAVGCDTDLVVRWSCSPDAIEHLSTLALVKARDRLSLSCAS